MPLPQPILALRQFCRRHPRATPVGIGLAVLAGIAFFVVTFPLLRETAASLPPLSGLRLMVQDWLATVPAPLYFLALVFLPAAGAPMTLFYLTALPVLGTRHPAIGIALVFGALALNMVFCRVLTHGLFLPAIQWVLRHRNLSVPRIRQANEWKITLATRLSPLPFAIQNYLLALGHARWRAYLWLSLPIQAAIAVAVMLLGQSVLTGGLSTILLALFLLLVLHLLLNHFRKFLRRDSSRRS